MTTSLSAANRESLKKTSTATLTTVLFKRGFRNVFIQGIFLLNKDSPRMVGEAYTLRYIPAREDIDQLGAFEGRGHPQREAIEACPPGHVLVMDARRDASAATGGDILMTRLKVRGVAGVLSDGAIRDTPVIGKMDFPVYCSAAAAPPSMNSLHPVETQTPVGICGVPVYPGDVIVADEDGAIVVPRALADEVARDSFEQERLEKFVAIRVGQGKPITGTYPPNDETKALYQAWIKAGEPTNG